MNAQEREQELRVQNAAFWLRQQEKTFPDWHDAGEPIFKLLAAYAKYREQFGASSLPQATPGGLQLFKSLADKVEDGEVSIDSLCDDKTARGWMGNRGQFDAGDNDEEALPQATPQDAPEHLPENRYKSTVGRD